ncbi:MAG: thioredoxin domain-containing protein [Rhodospirillaceae bacterium]|nr:thioredoxin domain-containing protein [Rhodospirillaceae bacterium]
MSEAFNHLKSETSPYLRQHKDNPVHWWPWGEAAFAAAQAQDKPVLLSVGYAACHWCHVMAHESFEDPATAELMNAHFINIKVDREERPDVDAIYQKALAIMGESGGWPLTMFVMPDGKPFWGGTYFPPEPKYGRPSFQQVLTQLARVWRETRDKVQEQATGLTFAVVTEEKEFLKDGLSLDLLNDGCTHLLDFADTDNGGLKGAPKFPMPFLWEFVWRGYKRTGNIKLKTLVTHTLDHICQGGIYDHLGGGFARYSTDARWLAPHFEKMLYDNAQLIGLLAAVWQETKSELYETRIAETIAWLEREMVGETGAYASALDADSEGEEGKFYVWSEAGVDAVLGSESGAFKKAYDVTVGGNWEHKVILNRLVDPSFDADEDKAFAPLRSKLLSARGERIRPGRDDKILADWNGLAVEGLVHASLALHRPEWLKIAERVFAAVTGTMAWTDGSGRTRLGHSFCDDRLQRVDVLDDYAHMANAALALHAANGAHIYLDQAAAWVAVADALFWDEAGGYFFTPSDRKDLIMRTKSANDAAQPSGNGALVKALARLAALTGDDKYRVRADVVANTFAAEAFKLFPHATALLNGYDLLAETVSVVIVGPRGRKDVQTLIQAAYAVSEPNIVLSVVDDPAALPAGHPAQGKKALEGKATAYVCRGFTCSAPVTLPIELMRVLSRNT